MAKDFVDEKEFDDEDMPIIEMVDDNGEKAYYGVDMVIPMEKNNFAILVGIILDEKGDFKDVDEENVVISRIEFDENSEEVYVAPTEQEFEDVKEAYEKMLEEWDDEE